MHEIHKQIDEIRTNLNQAFVALRISDLQQELMQKQTASEQPDFWQNQERAQTSMKDISRIKDVIDPWLAMQAELTDIQEFSALNDESLEKEISDRLVKLQESYEVHKKSLRFNGEYDTSNAVVTIQAGAGGTDAQDWAEMLKRMYVRWAEKTNHSVTVLDESAGEQAGIKQCSLLISGSFSYGQLAGEHGVHRLVRQSPFNSAGSRETSFAMVEVIPEIEMNDTALLDEKDLKIDVYRAGGHGGQSVNTTDSAVRITHVPTGVVVAIQNERSQQQNKDLAMKILYAKLQALAHEQHLDDLAELRGPNIEAAWGNQIRSYVLHPYTLVKDGRSNYESSDVQSVLSGELQPLIDAYLDRELGITSGQ